MKIKQKNKKNGKYSELQFAALAIKLGYTVLAPIEDSNSYDLLLEKKGKFTKIQVKSTHTLRSRVCGSHKGKKYYTKTYNFNTSNKTNNYSLKETDFIVAHIEPENCWYILPIKIFNKKSFSISKNGKSKYDKFKNNFNLLEKK